MTQTVPATAVLGPGATGLTIGYRVLNLDGTEYSAFTTTGVAETSTAGTYRVAGGVVAPLAGGYIVFGTAGTDYAEGTVESTAVNVTMQQGVAVAAADEYGVIPVNVLRWVDQRVDEHPPTLGALIYTETGWLFLTPERIRDAMLLAPTPPGTAAAGSVDAKLDGIGGSVAAELSNSSDCTASGAISRTRGNTWIINATVGAITGYTSLWLTIKHSRGGPDSDAILQVKLNASGVGDGLLYVNGTPASDSAKAAITVNNAATGTITITVDEVITAALPVGEFAYDIQTLVSGVVATPDSGAFTVTADVTRSIV